jgi:hypothetical protein
MTSYIYLIQTDNLVNSDIFKIGRTTQHGDTRFINRFRAYPQNSILKCIKEVPSSKVIEIESKIIQIFNIKYQLKNGREWFQGNCLQMISDIDCIINKYNDSITNVKTISQNNNTNENNNKYISKKDKLNFLKDIVDIDTFIDNYKNNTKYQPTHEETKIILETTEKMGIDGYANCLYKIIKQKYHLLEEEIHGKKEITSEYILPFFLVDSNLRNHYEKINNKWILTNSKDKIINIVKITDNMIFNHHQEYANYSSKTGIQRIVNIILRNACYSNIEPELNRLSKITQLEIEPVED